LYRTERILIATTLFVAGLILVLAVSQGMLSGGGSVPAVLIWLLGIALLLVAGVGALWVRSFVPPMQLAQGALAQAATRLPLDIILPCLLAVGAMLFLQIFEAAWWQAIVIALTGCAFALVLWAQAHTRDLADTRFALAQTALNVGAHLTAFLLFSVIYGLKVQSRFSATAVALVTALLLFEMLVRDASWHKALNLEVESRRGALGLLALTGGLVAGELTWGLNYWAALSTLVGGAFLLVVFYVVHGIAAYYVDRKLNRRVFVEFGAVGAIGLAVIFVSAFL